MTTTKQDPGSLPEIVEAIETAYDLAFSLVSRLRFAEGYATQAAELATVSFFESEDEEQAIAEAIAQTKGKLFERRENLIDLRSKIEEDLEGLREAFLGLPISVFEFSYAETGDFETTGDRAAYASLTTVAYAVRRWVGETISFLSLIEKIPVALDPELSAKCDALADGFPMQRSFEQAIRKRLLLEKSILTRNVKAYAEARGIIGSATTPQGRKKSEKSPDQIKREGAYLSLLAEYEKWQASQEKKKGRKRFNPSQWLEAQKFWSPKSKRVFKQLCGEKEGTEDQILKNAIRYAQKLTREQSSEE